MVSPAVHRSWRRRGIAGTDGGHVGLYLFTCEHQNSAGCFRLLPGYACTDLGDWPLERFQAALKVLVEAQIILTDNETSEVMILRWFKHCPPTNSKHYQGTSRIVAAIESERLRQAAAEALNAAWEEFQNAQAAKSAITRLDSLRQRGRSIGA